MRLKSLSSSVFLLLISKSIISKAFPNLGNIQLIHNHGHVMFGTERSSLDYCTDIVEPAFSSKPIITSKYTTTQARMCVKKTTSPTDPLATIPNQLTHQPTVNSVSMPPHSSCLSPLHSARLWPCCTDSAIICFWNINKMLSLCKQSVPCCFAQCLDTFYFVCYYCHFSKFNDKWQRW